MGYSLGVDALGLLIGLRTSSFISSLVLVVTELPLARLDWDKRSWNSLSLSSSPSLVSTLSSWTKSSPSLSLELELELELSLICRLSLYGLSFQSNSFSNLRQVAQSRSNCLLVSLVNSVSLSRSLTVLDGLDDEVGSGSGNPILSRILSSRVCSKVWELSLVVTVLRSGLSCPHAPSVDSSLCWVRC